MRTLITGGAGFIGSHLAETLIDRGDEVTVIDDLSTGSRSNIAPLIGRDRCRFVNDTILNERVVEELAEGADQIYHLAAAVGVRWVIDHPLQSLETNVRGTEIVLRAADRHRCKTLIASTSEVYGKNDSGSLSEDDDRILGSTRVTRWLYSSAKAADECLAFAYWEERRLPIVIVRFFNTIGTRQTGRYGMVVPRLIDQALRGQPLTVYGDGKQTRCFTDVKDAVRAVVALMDTDAAVGEVFNVGQPREISIEDLAHLIVQTTGSSSETRYVPYEEAFASGFEDMRRRVPDVTKLRQVIGFSPTVPLEHTLAHIVAEHQERLAERSA